MAIESEVSAEAERKLLGMMLEAASASGTIICEIYGTAFSAEQKADGSPVTKADQLAEAEILRRLSPTGLPVLAEESVSAGRIPELGRRWFVVDPLDGTKEFLKRNGEFTVNIALVEDGRPVLGVVLAPATGEAFSGVPGEARQYRWTDGRLDAGAPMRVTAASPACILASRSHGDGRLKPLQERLGLGEMRIMGSSIKFCLLARGEGQLYPRFAPTSEWDTAAGQAVLEAAGGAVLSLEGTPLRYGNTGRAFINGPFVAATSAAIADRAAAEMRAILG